MAYEYQALQPLSIDGTLAFNTGDLVPADTAAKYNWIVQGFVRQVDPDNTPIFNPGPYLPAGGSTGQVLAKNSNGDWVTTWIDPPSGGGGSGPVSADTSGPAGSGILSGNLTAGGTIKGARAEMRWSSNNTSGFVALPQADVGSGVAFATTMQTATGRAEDSRVVGDTIGRFMRQADGRMEWGAGGSAARDCYLFRDADGNLRTNGSFRMDKGVFGLNKWDVRLYGAKGDAKRREKVSVADTATSSTVTVPAAGFTNADVGKIMVCMASTTAGTPRKIVSVTSSTVAVLDGPVGQAYNGNVRHMAIWGTDDSAAFQAAANQAQQDRSVATDPGDNLPVSGGVAMVLAPAMVEAGYMIGQQVDFGDGVGFDADGCFLYNGMTDRSSPFLIFRRDTLIGVLKMQHMLGGGAEMNNPSMQCHFHADVIESWHPSYSQAGVTTHGYHHRIITFWVKEGGIGIFHDNSSDDYIGEAYMVGPKTGAKMLVANNITYGHLRGDTVTDNALLEIDSSEVVNIRGHAFVITQGTLANVIKIGQNTTVKNHGINIDMQVNRTGGAVLQVSNCTSSYFKLHIGNESVNSFGQRTTTGIDYGTAAGMDSSKPIFVDLTYSDSTIVPYIGTRSGSLTLKDPTGTSFEDNLLRISRSTSQVVINGASGSAKLAVTGSGTDTVSVANTAAAGASVVALGMSIGATNNRALDVRVSGDSIGRMTAYGDGHWEFGPGNAARDTFFRRDRANVFKTDGGFKTGAYTTATRPSATTMGEGAQIYDTDLDIPLWSNGSAWRDAAGTAR